MCIFGHCKEKAAVQKSAEDAGTQLLLIVIHLFFFWFQICQLTWGVSSNPVVRSGSSELRVCSERPPGVCALQLVLCWGLRCAKSPVSASPVISGKPSDKWVVNRVNSGHMYRPLFNYDAVNL